MTRPNGIRRALMTLLLSSLAACNCEAPPGIAEDAGLSGDGGAGGFDAGLSDAGPDDGGASDAGPPDAGALDAGEVDAGEEDAGALDAGEVDAGAPDAGGDDSGVVTSRDAGPLTCWSCHGAPFNPAPPRDTQGVTDRAARTVGAHQAHQGGSWHRPLLCDDCHRVPADVEAPGHLDPAPAELLFTGVPNAANVRSSFDGGTCTTYCHGVTLTGGTKPEPHWMTDPQVVCGQCHGVPPPAPHPVATLRQCENCHLDVFTDGARHVDGVLDFKAGCSTCHGDSTSPAPPNDTDGNTSPSARGVGAHRSHLGPSPWHAEVQCDECHVVPTRVDDPGHMDPSPAELSLSGTAVAQGAQPTWNGASCSNYCHGQTLDAGGANTRPRWTVVDGTQAACGTCHGAPPGGAHPPNANCSLCHGAVIGADGGFVNPALHVNGQLELQVACGSCHALPPATGTHLLHVGAEGVRSYGSLSTAASVTSPTGYAFGCGHCHPMDSARHLSGGLADLELYNPNAPPGSPKARSPLGQYTPGGTTFTDDAGLAFTLGTCSNVYCHSAPSFASGSVPRPGVDFSFAGYPVSYPNFPLTTGRSFQAVRWGGAGSGCGGCHGFPLRTSDATAKAGVGQSHSWVGPTGLESGHGHNHNDSPLSCRTCHFDTVKAANATSRTGGLSTFGPVPIVGWSRHVNGLPDVAFDPINPVSSAGRVQSLAGAAYHQATRTCSNVSCHASQTSVVNGHPFRPDQVSIECNVCHQY